MAATNRTARKTPARFPSLLFSASVCSGVLGPTGAGAGAGVAAAALVLATAFVDVDAVAPAAPAVAGLPACLDVWHPTSNVAVTNMTGTMLRINRRFNVKCCLSNSPSGLTKSEPRIQVKHFHQKMRDYLVMPTHRRFTLTARIPLPHPRIHQNPRAVKDARRTVRDALKLPRTGRQGRRQQGSRAFCFPPASVPEYWDLPALGPGPGWRLRHWRPQPLVCWPAWTFGIPRAMSRRRI